ncbi:MAG: peptidoglycan editing factor PgeF [Candidatus Schekmanbacteria bacterium]|nr:peptidoglycan editing factor PgeF [Candidatus Schekmanbacteria bacterium]
MNNKPLLIKSKLLEKNCPAFHCFSTRNGDTTGTGIGNIVFPKQVHGDRIIIADGQNTAKEDADAVITREPKIPIGILTADCVPVIVTDRLNRVGAVIHSGWKGTVQNIAGKTIRKIVEISGAKASELFAAVGPSIGSCCYEVGEDVALKFKQEFDGRLDVVEKRNEKFFVSLRDAVALELQREGISRSNIDVLDYCTFCDEELFYSYRRDGKSAGRMSAILML